MRVHPAIYHLFKISIRLALVLVFAGIPVALYILRTAGIGFGAREALEQALSSPTLEVRIGKVLLDPFNGLVAANVSIREARNSEHLLGKINRLEISLNLGELMKRRIAVDTLTLVRAEASIPLGPDEKSPRVEARDVNASLIVLGDRLRVSQLEATIEGLRLRLSGEILNPFALPTGSEDGVTRSALSAGILEKILRLVRETTFPSGAPLLTAEFEMDASDPSSLQIPDFQIQSRRIRHGIIAIESVEIRGEFTGGRLQIPVLRIRDRSGNLQASAEWDKTTGRLEASLLSGLDIAPILQSLAKGDGALSKMRFSVPPRITVDLKARTGEGAPSIAATGDFFASAVEFEQSRFNEVGFSFSWKDGVFYTRELKASAKRGSLQADVWAANGDLRIRAKSTIPPSDLADFFDPNTRAFLSNMEFADLPEISLSLRGARLDFSAISGSAHLKLGRTANRGAWIDSGEADVEIADRCLTYKNILIATGKGRGSGSFAYDIGRQEVRLKDIVSTLVPVDVMMWIDPRIAGTIRPYRFRGAPKVKVEGKVHMRNPLKNDLAIGIEAPGGLDYDLLHKTLPFGKTSAKVDVVANKVTATIANAELFGGKVGVKAVVSIDPANPVFSTSAKLSRVNFAKLTRLYFNYDDSKGVISGDYDFTARMGDEENMTGRGSLRIEDGNVFAIPILGPFSAILGSIIPGVVYNTARLATADFTVANRKINTHNIEIAGTGFSMFGYGDIYFLTGRLDLSMRINAQGVPGIVFFPVSKLLEYHADGTVSDPGWRPKIIPKIPLPGGKTRKDSVR